MKVNIFKWKTEVVQGQADNKEQQGYSKAASLGRLMSRIIFVECQVTHTQGPGHKEQVFAITDTIVLSRVDSNRVYNILIIWVERTWASHHPVQLHLSQIFLVPSNGLGP